ncbi:MAG: aldo/keto reductase [Spirochaetaceae bacterium]|nr:MAG: aldo/keto reductase [Spirochaetaceae bacterium]
MKTYTLGKTEIQVTPVGLGCWQFSQGNGMVGKFWPTLPAEVMSEIVRVSIDGGINWFDTAEIYGRGASERALAAALTELKVETGSVVIADKWWPALRFASSIAKTFPERERCLAGYPVDLHQIHQPFSLSSVKKQAEAMAELVRAGKVRAAGVSNFSAKAMRIAHATMAASGVPLASNQVRYSLLDRDIERNGVLETAKELGITIIAYSPLSQGLLTGKYHGEKDIRSTTGPRKWMRRFKSKGLAATRTLIETLREIGIGHSASAAQIAIAWTVQRHGETVVAIPGASSVAQAESNAATLAITLTPSEITRIDEASRDAETRLR